MIVAAIVATCALIALLFIAQAGRCVRRRRVVAGTFHGLSALVFLLAAAATGLLGIDLLTYQRLTYEAPAAEVQFSKLDERRYQAKLTYASGETYGCELLGDEWQIDARVLKWHGFVNVIGFDSAYRLERIGGRYRDTESERSGTRTVYALNAPARVDTWELARRYREWVPWVDALYGSAVYLPMADGALYQVSATQNGLIARPLNQAARGAIAGWQ